MRGPRILARLIDLRAGEARFAILSFLVLALASAGHTALETARDAVLVTRLPPRQFGIVYIAVAVCALPAATLLAHVARRWDDVEHSSAQIKLGCLFGPGMNLEEGGPPLFLDARRGLRP